MIKFPNANELSTNFNLTIFDEINMISREIYLANSNNLSELFLTTTNFTNLNDSYTYNNVIINSSTDVIDLNNNLPLNTKQVIKFIAVALPSPILGSLYYFIKPETINSFKISTTYQNLQENKFVDIITSVTTPVGCKFVNTNEYYSGVWSGRIRDLKVKNNISTVIKHFTDLYYKITFKPVDSNSSCWHIRW